MRKISAGHFGTATSLRHYGPFPFSTLQPSYKTTAPLFPGFIEGQIDSEVRIERQRGIDRFRGTDRDTERDRKI